MDIVSHKAPGKKGAWPTGKWAGEEIPRGASQEHTQLTDAKIRLYTVHYINLDLHVLLQDTISFNTESWHAYAL